MCGRFITPDQAAIEREWGLIGPVDFKQSYNLAPSQRAPVIRLEESGEMNLSLLTWGFQPGWAKRAWINARSETVYSSKAFASAARKRRCIVPAIGWYEWQGKKAPRQPYVFHRDGFLPFAFAGIWTAPMQASSKSRLCEAHLRSMVESPERPVQTSHTT